MVKHIVFWNIKAGLDKETVGNEMKSKLEALAGQIPGLLKAEVGLDFNRSAAAFDIALCSEFTDEAALANYGPHPLHEAAKAYIGGVTDGRAVVDYLV